MDLSRYQTTGDRMAACGKDLLGIFGSVSIGLFVVLATFFRPLPGLEVGLIAPGFVLWSLSMFRFRFSLLGIGFLVCALGSVVSFCYSFTRTPRPPSDPIIGGVLLVGLTISLVAFRRIYREIRAEEKRVKQEGPGSVGAEVRK